MAKQKAGQPKMRFVDLPELTETFSDSLGDMFFDGTTLRLTFLVTRWDEPKPPSPPTGRQYPTCRLVMTSTCAEELHKRLNQVAAAIEQSRKQQGNPTIQ